LALCNSCLKRILKKCLLDVIPSSSTGMSQRDSALRIDCLLDVTVSTNLKAEHLSMTCMSDC